MPTADRNLSGHFINVSERFFLIDCGEGTQYQLIKFRLRFLRINNIFSQIRGYRISQLPLPIAFSAVPSRETESRYKESYA